MTKITAEDRILIKNLRIEKQWSAKRIIKELPNKASSIASMSIGSLKKLPPTIPQNVNPALYERYHFFWPTLYIAVYWNPPVSQCLPVKPCMQLHLYEWFGKSSTQVAPFRQLLFLSHLSSETHQLVPGNIHWISYYTQYTIQASYTITLVIIC